MKKLIVGLTAAAVGLAGASLASAHPVQAQSAIGACTHHSATVHLTAADTSWLGKTIDCMYGSMLYRQTCGPQTLNGGCTMAGGDASNDLVSLAKRLLPKLIHTRSGGQLGSIASAEVQGLRISECPARYHVKWYADDSAGPQSTSPTLSAAASELRNYFFAHGTASEYFGAAAVRGEVASGGGGQSQVSYLVPP